MKFYEVEFYEYAALFLTIAVTLAYCLMQFRKLKPFIRQAHNISRLKERSDLVQTTAEIVEIACRDLNESKYNISKLYVMRVQYSTENVLRGVEHADVLFAKEPTAHAGQKIKIIYSRADPSVIMTADNRESEGFTGFWLRIFIGVLVFFGIVLLVFYWLCKNGLPD